MALNSTIYHIDALRSKLTRGYHDAGLNRAYLVLQCEGTLAGVVININNPTRVLAALPVITITEGVDFANVVGDKHATLMNMIAAIQNKTGWLKISGGPEPATGGHFVATVEATQVGAWGEGITFQNTVTANAGNLRTNGTAGAGTYNPMYGASPDAVTEFQDFLNSLGVPIQNIRVQPVFSESSSLLVTWEV